MGNDIKVKKLIKSKEAGAVLKNSWADISIVSSTFLELCESVRGRLGLLGMDLIPLFDLYIYYEVKGNLNEQGERLIEFGRLHNKQKELDRKISSLWGRFKSEIMSGNPSDEIFEQIDTLATNYINEYEIILDEYSMLVFPNDESCLSDLRECYRRKRFSRQYHGNIQFTKFDKEVFTMYLWACE